MSAAARKLGSHRAGKPVHPSTLTRWVRRGCPMPSGGRVYLEAMTIAGKLLTSWPAVLRFLAAQQPPIPAAPSPVRTPMDRRRSAERAIDTLLANGC